MPLPGHLIRVFAPRSLAYSLTSFANQPSHGFPVAAGSKRKHYIEKLGATASVFFDRVEGMAADLGMKIEWEGRLGSSWDSHKLILLAMEQDEAAAAAAQAQQQSNEGEAATSVVPYARTDETVMALFRGIFEESRDPADRHFLVEVALRVGLVEDGTQLLAWLDEPELRARVEAETAHAKAQRISAVPTFVVQGRYRVGGMQEPGVFLMLFDKIRANEHGLGRPIPDVTGDFMEAKICSGEQAYSREREERERKI